MPQRAPWRAPAATRQGASAPASAEGAAPATASRGPAGGGVPQPREAAQQPPRRARPGSPWPTRHERARGASAPQSRAHRRA
eukprot:3260960-Alexandrium_andersonii.AAC.1